MEMQERSARGEVENTKKLEKKRWEEVGRGWEETKRCKALENCRFIADQGGCRWGKNWPSVVVHILRPTSTKARIHYYYHRKAKPDGATTAGCFRVGCHGDALGQPRGAAWNNHPLASFPRFTLLSQHSLSSTLLLPSPHSSSLTLCQSSHLACFLAPTSFPSPAVPNLWIPFLCATPGPYPRHHGAVVIPAPAFESIPLLLLSNLLPSCVPLSISWWVDSLCCYV